MATLASSSAPNPTPATKEKDLSWYLPLYKAVTRGDWDTVKDFLDVDPNVVTAKITNGSDTTLHVAVGSRKATPFLQNLLDLIPPKSLETLTEDGGGTVLDSAAVTGNIEAAKMLVARNPLLPNTWHGKRPTPIEWAASYGHRELTSYLFDVTDEHIDPNPFAGELGVRLLNVLIHSELYDMALQLFRRNPKLGTGGPLSAIAVKPSAFPSGTQYKPWQWFIYSCVPVKSENISKAGDSENPNECHLACAKMSCWVRFAHVSQKLHHVIWSVMERLVPQMKGIRETKQMHSQTLELVKGLCREIASLDDSAARSRFTSPVLSAARLGIHEVVEEILDWYPPAIWSRSADDDYLIIHAAVFNRREKVFNLYYQLSEHDRLGTWLEDDKRNTILHLAGKLAPPHRVNLVSGAALQMQRELQWYKEVQKWVQPEFRERVNLEGKKPAVVFTEEHKDLVIEGERWMKDTANSCSVAAALIVTIAFAAAITVPGGTNGDSGFPIFSREVTFVVFATSNAVSLFSSTASLLMFLSILTARYAEEDFAFSLPRRLIIGLITLFLSITSMMIAFSATLYLVVGNNSDWILILVAASACLPVTLFVSLQFPLLVDMISSTYGPGMFGPNK